MKQRVEVRVIGLLHPDDRPMFDEFVAACDGKINPDGLSFTAEIDAPADVAPFKGSPGAFLEALERQMREEDRR